MQIESKTVYTYNGNEYTQLSKIKEAVENTLGNLLDQINPPLTPKQGLQMLKLLTSNRSLVREALNVTYEDEEQRRANILDLK